MNRNEVAPAAGVPAPDGRNCTPGRGGLGAALRPHGLLGPALACLLQAVRLQFADAPAAVGVAGWPPLAEMVMLLTPAQAAQRVGISVSLIYQLCTERRLPHYRVGGEGRRGKVLIDEQDLDAFLSDCRVDASGVDETEPLKHIR